MDKACTPSHHPFYFDHEQASTLLQFAVRLVEKWEQLQQTQRGSIWPIWKNTLSLSILSKLGFFPKEKDKNRISGTCETDSLRFSNVINISLLAPDSQPPGVEPTQTRGTCTEKKKTKKQTPPYVEVLSENGCSLVCWAVTFESHLSEGLMGKRQNPENWSQRGDGVRTSVTCLCCTLLSVDESWIPSAFSVVKTWECSELSGSGESHAALNINPQQLRQRDTSQKWLSTIHKELHRQFTHLHH